MQHLTPNERDARNAAIKAEYDETDHSARHICDKYRIGSKTLYRIVDGGVRIPRIRQIAFGAGDGRRCAAGRNASMSPDGTRRTIDPPRQRTDVRLTGNGCTAAPDAGQAHLITRTSTKSLARSRNGRRVWPG